MSSQQRRLLFQTLSALPPEQFEQLRYTLNPPPGVVPPGVAAQGNRVAALLSWVEGSTGCGLEHLYGELEQLFPGVLQAGKESAPAKPEDEPAWLVPYGRNPYFTGREAVLTALHQQLNAGRTAALSQTQAISGLGGIGKTQTAVEYAYRYRDDYRHVFWIRADTELELTNSYVAIAQTLNLPLKDAENQDETVRYVRLWLSREAGWLLIFDNADRPERVQPFLPREVTGHILVTSRAQDFQDLGIVQPLEMTTLSPEEAITFLLTRTGRMNLVGARSPRPMQRIEPLAGQPDGQTIQRQGAIPPTPLKKGGSRPDGLLDNLFPPSTRGARGDQDSSNKPSVERQTATDLAAELGYLPLALEQATAYIVTNRVSFGDYLTSYRKQRLKRLEKAKPKLGQYPESIATTWALNLKEVQTEAPAAAALLTYCAFLHADAIPFTLFTQGTTELGEPLATALADAADDPLELYDLLNPLCRYSLIRVEPEGQSLSLHRLLQEVIRAELGDAGCQSWVEPLFRAMAKLLPEKSKDIEYQDWPALAPLVNHVQDLSTHCQQRDMVSTEAADVFHAMGIYLLERGQYDLADPLLQKALDLRCHLLGNEHENVANSLDSLGYISRLTGRYGESEHYNEQALALREKLLGSEHPNIASSLNNLALLYKNQGRYGKAAHFCQRALVLRKRLLGNNHLDIAVSLNNLATIYEDQGHYGKAEPFYQKALAMRKKLLGDEHPDVAASFNNLASLYYAQGQYGKAVSLAQQALALLKKLLGDEHPDVATSLNNLASLYCAQGCYRKAEPLHQEALALRRQLLGDDHPDVALSLNNLANLYRDQGSYDKAEPYLCMALQLFRQLLGEDHPNVGRVTENLGILYTVQGRTEEARTLYQQALAILEPKLGADHPWTVRCRENLAKLDDGE